MIGFIQVRSYKMVKIYFFGTDGGCLDAFCLSREIDNENDNELLFLSDKVKKGSLIQGCQVIGSFKSIENCSYANCEFVYQCGSVKNHFERDIWFKKALENQMIPKTLISSHSYIHESASIGIGSIIYHGVKIMRNVKIGQNCVILPNTIINHDVSIGDFSIINSSCVLNGGVEISSKVFIGSMTAIRENVKIASKTTIGMSSIILNDIVCPGVYYGQPIK
ncbi:MAG: hypothetical protein CL851_00110 [Crocinitomicaceae bacterium]|nr:hypothetical protein [Crocinitomicaceae bacterium]